MTEPKSGPDSPGALPDQRRPAPTEAGPGAVRRGSFGVDGPGDTSGFSGLVRRPATPAAAERPYGDSAGKLRGNVFAAASDFKAQNQFVPTHGKPRSVHVLKRGSEKDPLAEVGPGTCGYLPQLKSRFAMGVEAGEAEILERRRAQRLQHAGVRRGHVEGSGAHGVEEALKLLLGHIAYNPNSCRTRPLFPDRTMRAPDV